ncbi:MAG: hypothetical protein PHT19_08345 [Methylococcus sp.]|nr:hypothetical protein [Methylococcus sp.]
MEPESPRDSDAIVVSYYSYGCSTDSIRTRVSGRTIDLTVTYHSRCPAPDGSETGTLYGPGFYRQVVLGRLPAGNYVLRLYRRDVDEDTAATFDTSESFTVMPTR